MTGLVDPQHAFDATIPASSLKIKGYLCVQLSCCFTLLQFRRYPDVSRLKIFIWRMEQSVTKLLAMAGNVASKLVLKWQPRYVARTVSKLLPARGCQPAAQLPRGAQTLTPDHSPPAAFWFVAKTNGPFRSISNAPPSAATCSIGAACNLMPPGSIYRHSNAVVQFWLLQFAAWTFTATLPDLEHCSLATACAWFGSETTGDVG